MCLSVGFRPDPLGELKDPDPLARLGSDVDTNKEGTKAQAQEEGEKRVVLCSHAPPSFLQAGYEIMDEVLNGAVYNYNCGLAARSLRRRVQVQLGLLPSCSKPAQNQVRYQLLSRYATSRRTNR